MGRFTQRKICSRGTWWNCSSWSALIFAAKHPRTSFSSGFYLRTIQIYTAIDTHTIQGLFQDEIELLYETVAAAITPQPINVFEKIKSQSSNYLSLGAPPLRIHSGLTEVSTHRTTHLRALSLTLTTAPLVLVSQACIRREQNNPS